MVIMRDDANIYKEDGIIILQVTKMVSYSMVYQRVKFIIIMKTDKDSVNGCT